MDIGRTTQSDMYDDNNFINESSVEIKRRDFFYRINISQNASYTSREVENVS